MTARSKLDAAFREAGFEIESTGGNCQVWIRRRNGHATVICQDPDPILPSGPRTRCALHVFSLEPDGSWGHDEPVSLVRGTAEQLLLSVKLADWHAANVARSE